MNFSFHPEAEDELLDAVARYENLKPGLGIDFSREMYAAVQSALHLPRAWSEIEAGIRRRLVHRFPYSVLYCLEQNRITILAVMHHHRAPEYWKHRVA